MAFWPSFEVSPRYLRVSLPVLGAKSSAMPAPMTAPARNQPSFPLSSSMFCVIPLTSVMRVSLNHEERRYAKRTAGDGGSFQFLQSRCANRAAEHQGDARRE